MTVKVEGRDRPVLRLGKRLFVGEMLSMLNPYGFGGRVWAALDIDMLRYNVSIGERRGPGHRG